MKPPSLPRLIRRLALAAPVAALFALGGAPDARAACEGRDLAQDWSEGFAAQVAELAAAQPHPEGRFFEVERDGRRSVLFGTIHLPAGDTGGLPAALEAEIAAARAVHVELTRAEEARMMQAILSDPSLVMEPGTERLSDALTEAEIDQIRPLLPGYGLTLEIAERIRPWYLAITLANPACLLRQGPEAGPILDRVVEARAEAAGVPVRGLETFEEVFGLFDAMSRDQQVAILRAGLPAMVAAEDYLETTRQMYLDGEIQKIWAFGYLDMLRQGEADTAAAELFFGTLIETRNRRWLTDLLPALAEGGQVVAVGALHLGGEQGLLKMLEAEGFAVRRVLN